MTNAWLFPRTSIPRLALLLGLMFSIACGSPTPVQLEAEIDLVAELRWAESMVEPTDLGIGTDTGRRFLGPGWWANEGPTGDRFVWGLGQTSEFTLPIASPRDLVLVLDLRPFSFPSASPQHATVELNGTQIFEFTLAPGSRGEVRVPLPEEHLTADPSLVKLHWQWSRSPREVNGSRDPRQLAAALHGARLCDAQWAQCGPRPADGTAPAERQVRAQDGRIWLPWGSRVDFFVELPADAWLQADLGFRGEGSLSLAVLPQADPAQADPPQAGPPQADPLSDESLPINVQGESQSAKTVSLSSRQQAGAIRQPLAVKAGWARLRFVALGAAGGDGGVRLELPSLSRAVSSSRAESAGAQSAEAGSSEAVASGAVVSKAVADPAAARGLVVYSIDTLRADRLGYRGGPVATPAFDQFADQAVVFDQLLAQSPWTKASMASIFTGLWPPTHGAVNRKQRLDSRVVTLAEILHASGWATAAIVTNPNITETFGFDQGFESFEYLGEKIPAHQVNQAVERLLSNRNDPRPLFLWVHILDPHSPYDPPAEFRRRRLPEVPEELAASSLDVVNDLRSGRLPVEDELMAQLLALYHTEIAYSDASFARFLELLETFGLSDSVVTVISDHGEEFLEHGNLEHGRALHIESLDVPWMIRGPHLQARRIEESAQHMDVLPTLLATLKLPTPHGLEGHAWLTADGSVKELESDRVLFSHLHLDGDERLSASDGSFKLISVIRGGEPVWSRLFDIRHDPLETVDVLERHPVRTGRFKRLLRQRLANADAGPGTEVEFDEETRKSLEALGYL